MTKFWRGIFIVPVVSERRMRDRFVILAIEPNLRTDSGALQARKRTAGLFALRALLRLGSRGARFGHQVLDLFQQIADMVGNPVLDRPLDLAAVLTKVEIVVQSGKIVANSAGRVWAEPDIDTNGVGSVLDR
jgi:hypothetical protein